MDDVSLVYLIREIAFFLVDSAMLEPSLHRFIVVGKVTLNPLDIREPGTVDKLVDHPRGDKVGVIFFIVFHGQPPAGR
jgi:hypothetical protein